LRLEGISGKKAKTVRQRVPTKGLDLITNRIRQQTSRRRESPQAREVKIISHRKRITHLARSVVKIIRESAK